MPGPGGGGHGGGFGGGGSFGGGGGFRGGGFHHGPHRPMGPRPGGCLFFPVYMGGGCLSAMIAPFVCLALAIVLIFSVLVGGFGTLFSGGKVTYSESKMQSYADSQYRMLYESSSATFEDNVVIVLLTNEDNRTWYCIGWVGDNLKGDVQALFGNEYTRLGSVMKSSVNAAGYQYSLGSNLANAAEKMQEAVEGLGMETVYRAEKAESHAPGKVWNRSKTAQFNSETVDAALKSFTEATDISMSIVVADAADVFGKTLDGPAVIALLVAVALIVVAVINIARYVRRRREGADDWR